MSVRVADIFINCMTSTLRRPRPGSFSAQIVSGPARLKFKLSNRRIDPDQLEVGIRKGSCCTFPIVEIFRINARTTSLTAFDCSFARDAR
jgi:hypothetical protein